MKSRTLPLIALVLTFGLIAPSVAPAQESAFVTGQRVNLSLAGVAVPTEIQTVSKVYTVSSTGTLNLPHIGEIKVSGLTRSEIEKRIEQAYISAEIYTNPTITIVTDMQDGVSTRFITVSGEVRGDGQVPYRDGMRLLDAIAQAGGTTEFGDMGGVVLMRGDARSAYDLTKVSRNPSMNVVLRPNDTVIVPHRKVFPF